MLKKVKKATLNTLATTVGGISGTVNSLSTTVNTLSGKLDKLSSAMEAGFKRMDKGFKEAKENNESLARMVAGGFEHVNTDIFKLKEGQAKLEQGYAKLEQGQIRLEQGQENIQLRLDYLAPQFEVKQLTRRVKRLEDKIGIRQNPGH